MNLKKYKIDMTVRVSGLEVAWPNKKNARENTVAYIENYLSYLKNHFPPNNPCVEIVELKLEEVCHAKI